MADIPKVILLIDTSRRTSRDFLKGIARYVTVNNAWQICLKPLFYRKLEKGESHLSWFKDQKADGIIVRDVENPEELLKLKLPNIISSTAKERNSFGNRVITDSKAIVEMAAEHLLNCGFKQFAYCGFEEVIWSRKRAKHFGQIIQSKDLGIHYYQQPQKLLWKEEIQFMAQWLQLLPKPIGLMACNDDRAFQVAEACKIVNVRVPEEVAILGVDNDNLICDLAYCPLSSVAISYEKAGYEAAKRLDNLMAGRKTSTEDIVVKPLYIATRQSTDILAIEDPQVAKAVNFIRHNFKKTISVTDVIISAGSSRRVLEKRFRKVMNRSMLTEINRNRAEHLAYMLVATNLSIAEIAGALEYTSLEHIARQFRKIFGMSLRDYRKKHVK